MIDDVKMQMVELIGCERMISSKPVQKVGLVSRIFSMLLLIESIPKR